MTLMEEISETLSELVQVMVVLEEELQITSLVKDLLVVNLLAGLWKVEVLKLALEDVASVNSNATTRIAAVIVRK